MSFYQYNPKYSMIIFSIFIYTLYACEDPSTLDSDPNPTEEGGSLGLLLYDDQGVVLGSETETSLTNQADMDTLWTDDTEDSNDVTDEITNTDTTPEVVHNTDQSSDSNDDEIPPPLGSSDDEDEIPPPLGSGQDPGQGNLPCAEVVSCLNFCEFDFDPLACENLCLQQASPYSMEILSNYSTCAQGCAGSDACIEAECQAWVIACLNDGGSYTPPTDNSGNDDSNPNDPNDDSMTPVGQGTLSCFDVLLCLQDCELDPNLEVCQAQCLNEASPYASSIFQGYNTCYDSCAGNEYCIEITCQTWVDACINDTGTGSNPPGNSGGDPLNRVMGTGSNHCMEVIECLGNCAYDFDPPSCETFCLSAGTPEAVEMIYDFEDCYQTCAGNDACVSASCQAEILACQNDQMNTPVDQMTGECEYSWECDFDEVCSPEQMCVECNEDWDCSGFSEVCNQITHECEPI